MSKVVTLRYPLASDQSGRSVRPVLRLTRSGRSGDLQSRARSFVLLHHNTVSRNHAIELVGRSWTAFTSFESPDRDLSAQAKWRAPMFTRAYAGTHPAFSGLCNTKASQNQLYQFISFLSNVYYPEEVDLSSSMRAN
jgi:hypothetical protein